ncbi:hypothetical protein BDV26DRAFT_259644 [Aspergillus bertholletiae]|uniref:Uncharacterized protein n=1 Tax=Aspergillus bertholletiae TaxID=1226010 RepID=A0A5N7BC62_9EURO|nr:hypothetical protein BDV26DRAFT_259644 [Aspergillus bertholletiae]
MRYLTITPIIFTAMAAFASAVPICQSDSCMSTGEILSRGVDSQAPSDEQNIPRPRDSESSLLDDVDSRVKKYITAGPLIAAIEKFPALGPVGNRLGTVLGIVGP